MNRFVLSAALMVWGCVPAGSDPADIVDTRILAVRFDPPEIIIPDAYARTALPGVERPTFGVEAEVFAFDPRGGSLELSAEFCRDQDGALCRDAPDNAPFGADRTDVNVDLSTPAGRVEVQRYSLDLTPDLVDYLVQGADDAPRFGLNPLLPKLALTLRSNEEHTFGVSDASAQKRLSLRWDTSGAVLGVQTQAFLTPFSLEVCEQGEGEFEAEGLAGCFLPAEPNENPVVIGFRVIGAEEFEEVSVDTGTAVDVTNGGVLEVPLASSVALRPVLEAGVQQRHQVRLIDPDTGAVVMENRFEDLSANWYVTDGSIPEQTTSSEPGSFTAVTNELDSVSSLDNVWSLPGAAVPSSGVPFSAPAVDAEPDIALLGTRSELVVVVQDQRGGVGVGTLVVEYVE